MKQIRKLIMIILIFSSTSSCLKTKRDQKPTQGITFCINGESFEMIYVEGGTFTMGCTKEQTGDCEENEKPAHEETISSFYIGRYEVTQKLWEAIMGSDLNQSYNLNCEECPVERVSWSNIQEFLSKINLLTDSVFRLPTEAEWEYAARGGKHRSGYKYSGSNDIDDVAWYVENYQKTKYGIMGTTHPVGTKKPNELGLYDMSGNVWEWCHDWYTKEYHLNEKRINPDWPFPGTPRFFRHIIRGGSWGGSAKGCRVAYIDYDTKNYRDEFGGFRLVLEIDSINVSSK